MHRGSLRFGYCVAQKDFHYRQKFHPKDDQEVYQSSLSEDFFSHGADSAREKLEAE